MSDQFDYRPGLRFTSPYAAYQFIVRGRKDIYSPDGVMIDQIPELVAEFGMLGEEYQYEDESGSIQTAADIRGFYFDLDLYAEDRGWSDADRAMVARVLLKECGRQPKDIQLFSKPPALKPWPKYDEAHHNAVPTLAEQLGLVHEALAYEVEHKNRDSVVARLRELLAQPPAVEELTAA